MWGSSVKPGRLFRLHFMVVATLVPHLEDRLSQIIQVFGDFPHHLAVIDLRSTEQKRLIQKFYD